MTRCVNIAIRVSSGAVYHTAVQLEGRFASQPNGIGWEKLPNGEWSRPDIDAVIADEVKRLDAYWSGLTNRDGTAHADRVSVLDWRRITEDEHAVFNRDRQYRNALTMAGDHIKHDMPKARECHRNHLRKLRTGAMTGLDAQWMRATGQGKKQEADAIEAQRQAWRDAPADPRIDTARTVDELKALTTP